MFRYKALNVMMDVEGRPRVVHTVSSYIDYSKDKQGFTQVLVFNFRDKHVLSVTGEMSIWTASPDYPDS